MLDDNQLTAFLAREANRLNLRRLDPRGQLFASIKTFLRGTDVVENELLDPADMPEPFRTVLADYLDTLDRYRLLTYGQLIVRAVRELQRGAPTSRSVGTAPVERVVRRRRTTRGHGRTRRVRP